MSIQSDHKVTMNANYALCVFFIMSAQMLIFSHAFDIIHIDSLKYFNQSLIAVLSL
jgi:hypothetical protein